jgi:hypothetical protein
MAAKMFHADGHNEANSPFRNFANAPKKRSYAGVSSVQPNLEDKCHFFVRVFRWDHFRISDTPYIISEPAKRQQAGTFVLTLGTVMEDISVRQGFLPSLYVMDPWGVCETYGPLQRNVSLNA